MAQGQCFQVPDDASGPVTVVRGKRRLVPGHLLAHIAAGADASGASQGAVGFAFEQAERRDGPQLAVCGLADAAGVSGVARQVEGRL